MARNVTVDVIREGEKWRAKLASKEKSVPLSESTSFDDTLKGSIQALSELFNNLTVQFMVFKTRTHYEQAIVSKKLTINI